MKNLFDNWHFNNILLEARIDDMIKKYPNYEDVIRKFSENDPAGNDKYLRWMTKQHIKNGYPVDFIVDITNNFHKNRQRLSKKDIYQWNPEDLQIELDDLGLTNKEKQKKGMEGAEKIYEDDRYVAVYILNKAGSCKYGAGTKWCITTKNAFHFEDYTSEGMHFIFLEDKKLDSSDPTYKIAIVLDERATRQDKNISLKFYEIYDAEDSNIAHYEDNVIRYLYDHYPSEVIDEISEYIKEIDWVKINKEKIKHYTPKFDNLIKFLESNSLRYSHNFVLEYQDQRSQITHSPDAQGWATAWVELKQSKEKGHLRLKIFDKKLQKTLRLRDLYIKKFTPTSEFGWRDDVFEIFSKLTVNDMRTISNDDDIIPIVPWMKLKGHKTLHETIKEDVTNFLLKEFAKAHPEDFKNLIGIWENVDIHSEQYEDYYKSLIENPDILRDIIYKNISKDLYRLLRMNVYNYLNLISAKLKDITNGRSERSSIESIFTLDKDYDPNLDEFLKDLEKIYYMSREIYKDKTLSKTLEMFVQ
jgi:hypothetical protein